ncbi:hypothetical protein JYT51_00750 [Candidatus Amoebophilus asiaticus]|nr:hypothetical protein [Candidatus Amoebophilus asiaticus]
MFIKLLLIIHLIVYSILTNAQEAQKNKELEDEFGYNVSYSSDRTLSYGFLFKIHFKSNAIRAILDVNMTPFDEDYYPSESWIFSQGAFIKLGYERQINLNKWQTIYGADIVLGSNAFGSDIYGLSPFLGIKYLVHPRIALSFESNIYVTTSSFKKDSRELSIGIQPLSMLAISYLMYGDL